MILISALQRIIVNIVYFGNPLSIGIIEEITYHNGHDGYTSIGQFYIKSTTESSFKGEYNLGDFDLKKNDTINFRILHNFNNVRAVKINGKKVNNYYGFWDYGSIIIIILCPLLYLYYPKLINKLKNK